MRRQRAMRNRGDPYAGDSRVGRIRKLVGLASSQPSDSTRQQRESERIKQMPEVFAQAIDKLKKGQDLMMDPIPPDKTVVDSKYGPGAQLEDFHSSNSESEGPVSNDQSVEEMIKNAPDRDTALALMRDRAVSSLLENSEMGTDMTLANAIKLSKEFTFDQLKNGAYRNVRVAFNPNNEKIVHGLNEPGELQESGSPVDPTTGEVEEEQQQL